MLVDSRLCAQREIQSLSYQHRLVPELLQMSETQILSLGDTFEITKRVKKLLINKGTTQRGSLLFHVARLNRA